MAIGFVEGKSASSLGTPTTTGAFTNAIVAGQLLVMVAGIDIASTGEITSVTDNKSNIWQRVPGMDSIFTGIAMDAWYCVPTTGGSGYTVTVNSDPAADMNFIVQYFNGFTATPTLDKIQHATTSGSSAVTSGATAATTQAVELVVGFGVHNNFGAWTLGAGYTNLTQSNVNGESAAMESKLTSATGTQTATFTIGVNTDNIGGVVTFYDATKGSAISPYPHVIVGDGMSRSEVAN